MWWASNRTLIHSCPRRCTHSHMALVRKHTCTFTARQTDSERETYKHTHTLTYTHTQNGWIKNGHIIVQNILRKCEHQRSSSKGRGWRSNWYYEIRSRDGIHCMLSAVQTSTRYSFSVVRSRALYYIIFTPRWTWLVKPSVVCMISRHGRFFYAMSFAGLISPLDIALCIVGLMSWWWRKLFTLYL